MKNYKYYNKKNIVYKKQIKARMKNKKIYTFLYIVNKNVNNIEKSNVFHYLYYPYIRYFFK